MKDQFLSCLKSVVRHSAAFTWPQSPNTTIDQVTPGNRTDEEVSKNRLQRLFSGMENLTVSFRLC